MKHNTIPVKLSSIGVALALTGGIAFGAANASDTAANYTAGWSASTHPNLGSGFGAWSELDNNTAPPYAGTYLDQTSYNNNDGVLSAGYGWGTYANGSPGNGFITLTRPFTTSGGTASLLNQTFSIGLGSKSGVGGAGSSIVLSVGTAFGLSYAGGGSDNFTLSVDGGAATVVPVTAAQLGGGLLVSLTVTGPANSTAEGYALGISPFAGGAPYYVATGTFDSSAYNTSNFSYTDMNTSGDEFVNNPTVAAVPEPSTLALFGLSGLATLLVVRRRK